GDREVLRRPGGRGEPRRGHRRGARHDRGRDRALPDPAGLPAAHAARPRGHRARLAPTGAGAAPKRRGRPPRRPAGPRQAMSRIATKPTLQPELFSYSFPIRVYYENTDAGGVVYHGEYLKFLERARTEWLRHLGFDHQELARSHRVSLVVTALAIDFMKP